MNELVLTDNSSGGPLQLAWDQMRPDDLSTLMRQGWLRGVRLEQDPNVQITISRFMREFISHLENRATRTSRQLRCMWFQFEAWCREKELTSLPAELETVKRYLSQRALDKHRNTLGMDRWAISRIHQECGCPDPTADRTIRNMLGDYTRDKVLNGETIKQATPLREYHLDELDRMWGNSPVLADRRDLALLTLAYETLLRAAEVARVKLNHLTMKPDGSAVLTIPLSKTNVSGDPDVTMLSRQAMRLIREYFSLAGRVFDTKLDDPLFAGINPEGCSVKRVRHLGYSTVLRIFTRASTVLAVEELGIPPFTAHSCRVGAAQDLAASGENALKIMMSGRWKSEVMVMRYCRSIFAEEGAMAKRRANRS